MKWPTSRLVAIQFIFYALGSVAAFISWMMILTGNASTLYAIVGDYLAGHFVRWTNRLYFWGPIVLVSGLIALVAVWFILRGNKIGGYLGILTFLIGFVVDIWVASVMFVHILIGLLIGWVLLAPLILRWDEIFSESND